MTDTLKGLLFVSGIVLLFFITVTFVVINESTPVKPISVIEVIPPDRPTPKKVDSVLIKLEQIKQSNLKLQIRLDSIIQSKK